MFASTHIFSETTLAILGSIGGTEMLVILVIAVIVVGPAKLPELARSVGKILRDLRRTSNSLRDSVYEELDDVRETVDEVKREALSGGLLDALSAEVTDDDEVSSDDSPGEETTTAPKDDSPGDDSPGDETTTAPKDDSPGDATTTAPKDDA